MSPGEFLYSCSQDSDVDADADADEEVKCGGGGGTDIAHVGISEELVWLVVRDIAMALQYMHLHSIAHLDLRPANIFVSRGALEGMEMMTGDPSPEVGETNPTLLELQQLLLTGRAVVRLGDLGQSCRLGELLLNEGESRYLPREVLNETRGLDLSRVDVFSLGASVYELLLGRELSTGGDTGAIEWHGLRDGVFNPVVESRYSTPLIQLLHQMMHPMPQSRPSAQGVYLQAAHHIMGALPVAATLTTTMEVAEMHRLRVENSRLRAQLNQPQR